MPVADQLKSDIDELVPDLVATRRDFHQHPELAFEEVRTSGIVAQRLQRLGLDVQTGVARTGVVAVLRGGAAGDGAKTIAIRADMDALPIHEQNEIDYRSTVDGKMHACGHDGHTAMLLAVADVLSRRRADLPGTIKFIFQPAEEAVGGALPMVQEGVMQGVDSVIGLHLISGYPVGRVGVRSGPVYASADKFYITVTGKGGHAAWPERAVDPIAISAYILTALQTLISRETSPFDPSVITVGMINAGSAFNIIPETAEMQGTMRTFSAAHRKKLLTRIRDLSGGIAEAMGGTCDVRLVAGCPPCVNNENVTAVVHNASVETVGADHVDSGVDVMTTASDDMAYFLDAAPGCYFIVGAKNDAKDARYPHHHPLFNVDEDALPVGVEVLARAAVELLGVTQSAPA